MTLSVSGKSVTERFRAQLEELLAWAERELRPEWKLAVCMPGGRHGKWRRAPGNAVGGVPMPDGEGGTMHVAAAGHFLEIQDGQGRAVPNPDGPRIVSEAWPPRLAIKEVKARAEEIVAKQAEEVEAFVRLLVPEDLRAAVLARPVVVERWRYLPPDFESARAHWICFDSLRAYHSALTRTHGLRAVDVPSGPEASSYVYDTPLSRDGLGSTFLPIGGTPPEVALNDAIRWAADAIAAVEERGRAVVTEALEARSYQIWPVFSLKDGEQTRELVPYSLGLLYLAWKQVDRDRRRPMLAIDAGRTHHQLLMGWEKAATEEGLSMDRKRDHVELLLPGRQQIALGLPGEAHEKLISEIQRWRSAAGLRTYATLLHLLSVRGARQGFVRWTLDEHLDVQGVPRKERREARMRAEAEQVRLLTKLELAVREGGPRGKTREVRPLFIVGSRFEKLHGSKWELDGLELTANPLIWRNVRDPETGKLGTNYGLGAEALPRTNPRTNPATLALGLLLPIRFRMALNSGRDYVDLKAGESVLPYSGLTYDKRDPSRIWRALAEDLDELQRIGGVQRWEWKDGAPPARGAVLRFYLADAARDRLALGVRPVELPPAIAARPLTGAELLAWRKARGLTQAKAATALGVGAATVKRAELAPGELLGPALRKALTEALTQAVEA